MAAPITMRNFRDAHITESRPTKNFVNTSRLKVQAGSGNRKRAFLFFGKPWPVASTITDGRLQIRNAELWSGSVTLTVEMLSASWAGSRINWNNQPGVLSTPASIAITKSNAAAGTLWEWDIKPFLQFVSNGGSWFGIRISTDSTTVRNIYSAQAEASEFRPQVVVQWTDAPDPPDGLEPSNNNAVSVAKPVLSYDFTDVSGDMNLAFQRVQIDDATDFATPIYDSGMVPSTEPVFDLANPPVGAPAFAGLANLDSRYWRVMVQDGSGATSDWSTADNTPPAQFRRVDKGTLTVTAVSSRILATNLVKNPNAETDAANWTATNGTITRQTTQVKEGAASFQIASTASGTVSFLPNGTGVSAMPIAAGQVAYYDISIRGGTLPGNLTATFNWYTAAGATNGTSVQTAFAPNASFWNDYGWSATAPASTAFFTVTLSGTATSAGQTLFWDRVSGVANVDVAPFHGGSTDTDVIGPYTYAFTGTANASTSTMSQLYVEDSSPTVAWTLGGGRTQTAYQVMIARADAPNDPLWDSGKVTSTAQSVTAPTGLLKSKSAIYRLTIRVWDDIQRQKEGSNPIYLEWARDFMYAPGTSVTPPSGLTVAVTDPWPWVDLTFTRSTPPDSFSVWRDNEDLVENDIDPGSIYVSGTTYTYRDRTANPRDPHTWTVVANVNGVDSQPSNSVAATTHPGFTWMMETDSSNPVVLVKSADVPTPAIDAQTTFMQEVHQPVGGDAPVLITQFIAGFEGHVDAVLSDDVVAGLTAKQMKTRFKKWKKNPGTTLLLYMVDEVLRVVPYNMSYRPRAKGGGKVLYDVSFDFFEAD